MIIDMTENYKQAPILLHSGFKKKIGERNHFELPQELMRNVFNRLNGKCGNQLKLLITLMGTAGNGHFRISQKWITDLTGMDESGYKRARQALADMGWITHKDGFIIVNFDEIWAAQPDDSPRRIRMAEGDMKPRASSHDQPETGCITACYDATAGCVKNSDTVSNFDGEASNPSRSAMTERIINNNKEEQIIYNKKDGGQSPDGDRQGPRELIVPMKKTNRNPQLLNIDDYLDD